MFDRAKRAGAKRRKSSRLRVESLEARELLAADVYISEVHFGPQLGDPLTDQYLEVRGTPGATVANDIYFLGVESKQSSNPGKINAIFNLSGLTFGANGYLAFLQQDHGFSTVGTVFVGTQGGFKGMPGGIYSGNTGQFESITGSESFLIVDTSQGSPPSLAQDIDTDDDGVIEAALGWNVTDSVTYFKDGTISDDVGYGQIVFRGTGNTSATVPVNATIVEMNKLGYVARIGNSTGHAKSDWVGGGTKELITPFVFEISDGDNGGQASPGYFAGKTLTHIGSVNFVSSISGSGPVDGTIFVDRNDNDVVDSFQTVAEPDVMPPSSQLINAFDGVTLTGASIDHEPTGFSITSKSIGANASTGSFAFAYSGVAQFSDIFQLRMDFLRPTEEVSIDFRSEGAAIGLLEAYDADDNLLQTYSTGQLADAELRTMTVAQPNIAYAVAYVDVASPSLSGYLDNLRFVQTEESTLVGLDGQYQIEPVSKKDNVLLVKHLGTSETEAVRKNALPATGVDLSGDPSVVDEIFGRTTTNGSLYVARPNANSLAFENWGVLYNGVVWDDIFVADVNGDGLDDVVGRTSGQWWVAASNGAGFTNSLWGRWSNNILWEDVQVADIDGDGTDDIIGRTSGQWWVARSTGTHFNIEYWGSWSDAVTWEDVQVGDFNGDQKADIVGRTGGQWWVSLSQGTHFSVAFWGRWSNAVTWADVTIGDYNGDGKSDIAGRTGGQWWVSLSHDTYFSVAYWGSWSNAVSWVNVMPADLNGDGVTDLVGRTSGQWWAARSTGVGFSIEYWGSWSNAVTWGAVVVADLDGDTMDDIVGRTGGSWWASMSKGGSFSIKYWGNWGDSQNWTKVAQGRFGSG